MTRVQTVVRSGPGPWLAVGYGCVLAVLSFGPRANLDSFFAPIRSEGRNGGVNNVVPALAERKIHPETFDLAPMERFTGLESS